MKQFIISVFFALVLVSASHGQRTILDSHINGVGMVSPQGERLYLRIYDNGKFEYEDESVNEKGLQIIIREGQLSKSDLKNLMSFLDTPLIQKIPKSIDFSEKSIDHFLELKISIRQDEKFRRIRITNFSVSQLKKDKDYSTVLLNLLCKIEFVRKNASFEVDPNIVNLCNK